MQAGWRIGSIFGIPIYIDSSWLVIITLMTVANGFEFATRFANQLPEVLAFSAGLAMALLLFASVLLHELGHSLAARSQGIQVNSITLFIFGGIAAIDRESKTPEEAFQVAIAGPAVSFMLFVLLAVVGKILPDLSFLSLLKLLVLDLSRINLVLGLFNLIPGLPLDGGQVLKAAVWKLTGDRFAGVHWAAKTGKALGMTAIALGLFLVFLADDFSGLWIALIGWFAFKNATAYDRFTDLQEALLNIHAEDAMTRAFRVVNADMTLRSFADEYILSDDRLPIYFAASHGRYRGLVQPNDLRMISRSDWENQTVNSIVHPLPELISVTERSSLVEVIKVMEANNLPWITVLSPAGAVSGTIDRGDIVAALGKKLNIPISSAEIKRIKEEGKYPPGFQLGAIADSTQE
jgi:Zn-dependent protease/CBS domain-containing protein